jgi:hypothetical protein
MDGAAAYWAEVIRYGETAVAFAERREPAEGSPRKTVLAFYQASQMLPFSLDDTTYQELNSAGDPGLIRDANLLRSQIGLRGAHETGRTGTGPLTIRHCRGRDRRRGGHGTSRGESHDAGSVP